MFQNRGLCSGTLTEKVTLVAGAEAEDGDGSPAGPELPECQVGLGVDELDHASLPCSGQDATGPGGGTLHCHLEPGPGQGVELLKTIVKY